MCVNVFIYTQLKLIHCKVLLETSLLSLHYLSSLNYSVASGKTDLGKENFQLKPTSKFFSVFLNSSNTTATQRLHTGCSTLLLGWLPAAVQHMAPSSWGVYFAIRTLQNVKFFPLQAAEWGGTGAAGELSSSASCRVTEMFLEHRISALSCRIQLAEMLQLFFKERERINKKETQELCR